MRGIIISVLTAAYLCGATEPQAIISEVSKLRQKYDECRQGQSVVSGIAPKVYDQCEAERKDSLGKVKILQSRITMLESQLKHNEGEVVRLKHQNSEVEKTLAQKQGVMKSLEQTLSSRDQKLRDTLARYDALNEQANTAKVSRIERQTLTESLVKSKAEIARLDASIAKIAKERMALERELSDARAQIDKFRNAKNTAPVAVAEAKKTAAPAPSSDQSGKIKSLQEELTRANALIVQLQHTSTPTAAKEKIVTKIVEPTDKIVALQNQLSDAQTMIANLKKGSKVVIQEKIVEKVVYKDRPLEKVVEKVVYRDRPVIQEKVVTKVVEPTAKITALQHELDAAQATIVKLKSAKPVIQEKIVEKVVYKERPVVQEKVVEKVVYKERPAVAEKTTDKALDATEKLNRALQQKLAEDEARVAKLKALAPKPAASKMTKMTAPGIAAPEKVKKAPVVEAKAPVAGASEVSKKSGPSAYRMATNAPVYNGPGGSVVETWEAHRSFTSGTTANGWVKITGYFVNRVWTRADRDLWVKESDVIRR